MGTSPLVMTARGTGKSIIAQIQARSGSQVWLDEFDDVFSDSKKKEDKPVVLEFNQNPLALTLKFLREGKMLFDVISILATTPASDKSLRVSDEDLATAETIYNYFSKKHMLRRIKGDFISEWMLRVDDLCENRKTVNKDNLKVLVSLPRIYKQNLETEELIKEFKSVPIVNTKATYIDKFASELEFVKRFEFRESNSRKYVDYFWKTPNDYLVKIREEEGSVGISAWDCLARSKRIKIATKSANVARFKGYDFRVLTPSKILSVDII